MAIHQMSMSVLFININILFLFPILSDFYQKLGMTHILEALIIASERAACVARACCSPGGGGALLVAEKSGGEGNARFDHDFKTIADVLAQECARRELSRRCPALAARVRGEECAEIGGVCVNPCDSAEQTTQLLCKLVPPAAAAAMAAAAHCDVTYALDDHTLPRLSNIDATELGVWIDPIDATAEFIAGVRGESDASRGLPCVTVLIGAYSSGSGEPVMGVINQPFFDNGKGRLIWGVDYGDIHVGGGRGPKQEEPADKVVLMSGAETAEIVEKFVTAGWEIKSVPGAGHKLLNVALGAASAYIVSKGTTFRWDTCGPHAILKARGGDIVCYTTGKPITYNDPMNVDTQQYANTGGIIAYSNPNVLDDIRNVLN